VLALGGGAFLMMKTPAGEGRTDMPAAKAPIAPAVQPADAAVVPSALEFAARDVRSGMVADRAKRQRPD